MTKSADLTSFLKMSCPSADSMFRVMPRLVGVVGQPVEALLGIGDIVVEGADRAAGIAAGRLHLDDIGAEIAEHPPAEEALLIRQVQDPERGQWRLRRIPSLPCSVAL